MLDIYVKQDDIVRLLTRKLSCYPKYKYWITKDKSDIKVVINYGSNKKLAFTIYSNEYKDQKDNYEFVKGVMLWLEQKTK